MKLAVMALVMAMLVMAVGATAQTLPMIIAGNIITDGSPGGYKVTCTNMRTDRSATFITDINGHFQFNPQNFPEGVLVGDDFKISVGGESVTVNDLGYNPVVIKIDLTGKEICPEPKECPDCPVCEECPEDTTPYEDCDSCCSVICADCDSCCECPEPEESFDWAWGIIIGILAGAGGSAYALRNRMFTTIRTGLKRYVNDYGVEKLLHKHPGIRGYHNPDIVHRNKNIAHPKGQIIVNYKKDENGNWKFTRD